VNPVLLPELRYRQLWMGVGLVLAGVIALLSLLPNKDLPDVHLWDKLKHTLAYVALAFWFGSVVVRRDYFWLGLIVVAFGGAIELLQAQVGRDAEWGDLLADGIGTTLGLLLASTPFGRWAHWLESRLPGRGA
jgi:VanZ family protein